MIEPSFETELAATAGALRAEWRDEQEALAREAAEAFRHQRTLRDMLLELAARGDRVAVSVGGVRVVGLISAAGAELVTLQTSAGRVEVRVDPASSVQVRVVERATAGGQRASAAVSLRARLLELEATGAPVRLDLLDGGEPLVGSVMVGADHVEVAVADAGANFVSFAAIAAVRGVS